MSKVNTCIGIAIVASLTSCALAGADAWETARAQLTLREQTQETAELACIQHRGLVYAKITQTKGNPVVKIESICRDGTVLKMDYKL